LISNQSRQFQITIKWLLRLIRVNPKSYQFAGIGCVRFLSCGRGKWIWLRAMRLTQWRGVVPWRDAGVPRIANRHTFVRVVSLWMLHSLFVGLYCFQFA